MTRDQFNEYVNKQGRKLYSFAYRILKNQEEAEDTVQEIFIKLWNMGDKLNEYNNIDALATTMTRNYCIDHLRKKKNILSDNYIDSGSQIMTSPSPHEQLELIESEGIVRRIIDSLPDKYKNVLNMREIDGLSYEEIAAETDQNINTLRVTLSRARGLLKSEYNKYCNEKRGSKQIT